MAITDNATANEVNILLNWLLPSAGRQYAVPRADAMKAAEQLASKAHRQLVAGIHGSKVRGAIPLDDWRFDAIDGGDRS